MTLKLDIWPTEHSIVPYGEDVLRQTARPVRRINSRIRKLIDRLSEVMYAANGLGLAAPQLGESVRVVVLDAGDGLMELVNPEILVSEGSQTGYEGCLSIPGYLGKVERANRVRVEALDRNGRRIWVEGEGLLARVLQHELDHLDGVLFVDRAQKLIELPPEARLSVVFMGTPEFGARVLEELLESQCRVEAVVTQPDRPRGRGQKQRPSPVKELAQEHKVTVLQPEKLRQAGFAEQLAQLEPDVIVTAAFGQFVPLEVLELPEIAFINVHPSLLPKYRGAAPIHRALLAGEQQTGVTIMHTDEGWDTGDIMLQETVDIAPDETAGSLHDKLAELGAELTVEALRLLATGDAPRTPQDDDAATHAKRIKKAEAHIDWQRSAEYLERMFRAFDPWPGAYALRNGQRLKVFRGALVDDEDCSGAPGTVVGVSPQGIAVATGDGVIALTELQPAGKRRMSVKEYVSGYDIQVGEVFE